MSRREILVVTTMEKGHKLFRSVEIKFKLFEFYLTCVWGDYNACIKILNALDLNEHGIQFLCVKEDGVSSRPRNSQIIDVKLAGLIEVEKGTTVGELVMFFRALLTPFQHCISLIKLCEDGQAWLGSCFEKKDARNPTIITRGGIVMKKGTLTVLASVNPFNVKQEKESVVVKKLPDKKRRRSRWD